MRPTDPGRCESTKAISPFFVSATRTMLRRFRSCSRRIKPARRMFVRARDLELREYGLSHEYAAVLFLSYHLGDSATPTEIARQRYRQPHTISRALTIRSFVWRKRTQAE